jgi:hypothetical protein
MQHNEHYYNLDLRLRPFYEQSKRCKTLAWEPTIWFLFNLIPIHAQALFMELANADELSAIEVLERHYAAQIKRNKLRSKNS